MKLNNINQQIKDFIERYKDSISDEQAKKMVSYIYIALTLFTVSFFGLFAIAPTLSTITTLNKQYEDNKLVYESLNKKLSNLQLLDLQYAEIQPDLENIYTAIPKTTQIPQLTRQLENLAASNNVEVEKLNFGTVEISPNDKKNPTYSFTFNVNVSGNQSNVNNFIGDLINFNRIVGIDRIITGQNEDNIYEAQITGRGYFSVK